MNYEVLSVEQLEDNLLKIKIRLDGNIASFFIPVKKNLSYYLFKIDIITKRTILDLLIESEVKVNIKKD